MTPFPSSRTMASFLTLLCTFSAGCDLTVEAPPEPTPTLTPTDHGDPWVADADCSTGRLLTVSYAVDGDTLEVQNDERIRLVGIDTPEVYGDVECYGPEASAQTKLLVNGVDICLTYDPAVTEQSNNIDAYGRTLGYVYFGEGFSRFLNAELVENGYANDYPFTDGAVFEDYFWKLEDFAQRHELGMWGVCY